MFAIAVELLAGRYTATQFNDRNEAEWPPHPARLYSAMVATWADSDDPDSQERAALRWLEDQGAPTIHCGEGYRRAVVTHFAAVNDPSALTRGDSWAQATYASVQAGRQAVIEAERAGDAKALTKAQATLVKAEEKATDDAAKAAKPTGAESSAVTETVLETLPDNRGKQGRTFPTVLPDSPSVWFTWPGASPGLATLTALDTLLGRVGRLGHSSTLVACRCDDAGPGQEAEPAWVPGENGNGALLRVPRVGLLDRLERAYETHHGEEPRTLPAGMASYRQPREDRRLTPRRPLLGGDWYVLGFTTSTDSAGSKFPFAYQALAVTRAVRGALLKHSEQPPPEFISGHERAAPGSGSTPPLANAHLAIMPLMSVGHRHSDGAIFGMALILPAEATTEDRNVIEAALSRWAQDGFELGLPGAGDGGTVLRTLEGLGVERATEEREPTWLTAGIAGARKTMRRDYWCRPARRWLSVTPVALDRFPGNLRSPYGEKRERAEIEAEAGIAHACVNAGLAERAEDVAVAVRLDAPLAGLPVSPGGRRGPGQRQYPGYKTGSQGVPRACVHAEIEFLRGPVQGPVLIGAGRFMGYGLFLPYEGPARARRAERQ